MSERPKHGNVFLDDITLLIVAIRNFITDGEFGLPVTGFYNKKHSINQNGLRFDYECYRGNDMESHMVYGDDWFIDFSFGRFVDSMDYSNPNQLRWYARTGIYMKGYIFLGSEDALERDLVLAKMFL